MRLNGHKPAILWFTGLSGSGKCTIANIVERELHAHGAHTYMLDGDNVRHGLNRDLGFTDADRVENIRRVGEVARALRRRRRRSCCAPSSRRSAPSAAWCASWSPRASSSRSYVDTPLEICKQRDPKGLYARALAGKIKNFTGIDSPYEPPEHAEIVVDTSKGSAEDVAARIVAALRERQIIS